jgi:hypothetical protein
MSQIFLGALLSCSLVASWLGSLLTNNLESFPPCLSLLSVEDEHKGRFATVKHHQGKRRMRGMLLELFGLLFFTYACAVLSSTLVFFGVFKALSTGKAKSAKTVEKPGDNRRRACAVCGAHEWLDVPPRPLKTGGRPPG